MNFLKSFSTVCLLLSCIFLLSPCRILAEDISFNLNVSSVDERVTIKLENTGTGTARDVDLTLELAGKVYPRKVSQSIGPAETRIVFINVDLPKVPGTYPLYSSIRYLNEGTRFSLLNVGEFNFQSKSLLSSPLILGNIFLIDEKEITISYDKTASLRLFLPKEISVLSTKESKSGKSFRIKNLRNKFRSDYDIFAVIEKENGLHSTRIVRAKLSTGIDSKKQSWFGSSFFLIAGILSFVLSYLLHFKFTKSEELSILQIALLRWLFSVFVVSAALFVFHEGHYFSDWAFRQLDKSAFVGSKLGAASWTVINVLLNWFYFRGGNYDYFSHYIADPLYFYMLFLNFFVLRFVIKPQINTDKYWHLMSWFHSWLGLRKLNISKKLVKLSILTLMVKFFYVPLLTSWTINNIVHQSNLYNDFSWSFAQVNTFLLALLILIDVTIFAVGYLTELPQLKNQIKSVEPTILGWVVCIMCYPPFNEFSFLLLDRQLFENWEQAHVYVRNIAEVLILLLWGIYVWATIALGFKASNLTNRGIVCSGPYAYVRHPAYISKTVLWSIQAAFLADMNFFLVISLFVIYYLRAWTEERHLSMDPDYLEYKKKVKWQFIPGLR